MFEDFFSGFGFNNEGNVRTRTFRTRQRQNKSVNVRMSISIKEAMNTQYNTNYIFSSQDLPLVRLLADYNILNLNKAAGIHWYGGHAKSQKFNNCITHENYKDNNTFMSYFIKKNYIK